MKNIYKYVVCCLTVASLIACGDLYETHEKYLKMGEETYIGLADSLQVNGGYKRVELKWKLNDDPRISTCIITWNGNDKPLEIPAIHSDDYMSKIIELPEGKYIFKIVVKSDSGKESLPRTISGESYGDNYVSRLPQKGINSFAVLPDGLRINWIPEEGCLKVNLRYTSAVTNKEKKLTVEGDATSTFIKDWIPGSTFHISSVFKPEANAIDDITSLEISKDFPAYDKDYYIIAKSDWDKTYHQKYVDVDRTNWTVQASTEEDKSETFPNGLATAILDGKLNTFWHSKYSGGASPVLPHTLTIDMLQSQSIMSVELARRSGNKDVKTVKFEISEDGQDGNWRKFGGELNFPDATDPNTMIFVLKTPVLGRFVRASVTASNNGVHASIAEIFFTSEEK